MPAPPTRLRPCSPSSPSDLDAPPPTRRRIFSTPLQPPLVPVRPPPHHTLSFKIRSSATSSPNPPILPPSRHTLSFKISNGSTLNPAGDTRMSICSVADSSHSLIFHQRDHPGLNAPMVVIPSQASTPPWNPYKQVWLWLYPEQYLTSGAGKIFKVL